MGIAESAGIHSKPVNPGPLEIPASLTSGVAQPVLLGVDVGGTFTDAVMVSSGRLFRAKVPTTRDHLIPLPVFVTLGDAWPLEIVAGGAPVVLACGAERDGLAAEELSYSVCEFNVHFPLPFL